MKRKANKIENLIQECLGEEEHFRDAKGRVVETCFLDREYYIREDFSDFWEKINERIPEQANASHIVWVGRGKEMELLYVIDYYKIKKK